MCLIGLLDCIIKQCQSCWHSTHEVRCFQQKVLARAVILWEENSTQGSAVQRLYTADWLDVTACAGGAAATTAEAPDRNALQLQLQELSLDNVDALEALKLSVQVSSALFHTTLALCLHHPVTRVSPSCHMSALSWLLMKCELLCTNMVSRRQYCVFCCNTANWLMLTRLLTCSHA